MSPAVQPIDADEPALLFGPHLASRIEAGDAVALAVSGGSDSTALMVLFADWLAQAGGRRSGHVVLTVDHGLRLAAAAEARQVGTLARALGLRHVVLSWQGAKPRTGLQAAAREARYALMRAYLLQQGIAILLTAHTRDDQAETLLMRLARGSGLDGLSGMAAVTHLHDHGSGDTVQVVRPLLDVPKARLVATLRRRGIAWCEDESNQAPAFERTRLRAAQSALAAIGLTPAMLSTSARRLGRARAAIEAATADAFGQAAGIVQAHPCGTFRIDRARLSEMSEEVALRVLGRAIAIAGGSDRPIPLARLEAVAAALKGGAGPARCTWTLARARILADATSIAVEREPGRLPLPALRLTAGERGVWDGRFAVALAKGSREHLEVRALGADGVAIAKDRTRAGVTRSRAARLAPGFWQGSTLVAAPCLGVWAQAGLEGQASATFLGLRYNSSAPGMAGAQGVETL